MWKNSFLIILFATITLVSCAHRSGQNRHNRKSVTTDISHKLKANISSSRSKMEGSEVFRKYSQAVFMVFTTDGNNVYQGSGFFIGDNGLAVSNYHVFKGTNVGDEAIKMSGDNSFYKVAEIYANSEKEDFILFRIDYDNEYSIPIADKQPQVGDKVFAIGSPKGLENTFSSGEVSQWRGDNLMQISALIDHGSSGGALINEYGEVVGITSGSFADGSQANLNYAWSIDVIKPYLKN